MSTIAFIGCGNMGSAILGGILDATREDFQSGTTPKISRFIVSTKSAGSADRLRKTFQADEARVTVGHGQNLRACQEADIIMLACKPFLAKEILQEQGIAQALQGKFVISIMAGMKPNDIKEIFRYGSWVPTMTVARAMPNVASRIRQSLTIIEENSELSEDMSETLTWMFSQIGTVKWLPSNQFDIGGHLAGASMAIFSTPLDGILDGCVVEGMRRAEALEMAAQVLTGMAGLLKEGDHPALMRESISSPRGCTIQSLLTLERQGVRGAFADSMINGVKHLRGEK
ncbi:pyrroline-5-carboxylate reductase [Aspergillus steynii IBT 23096]|uniref:Pyrroline-5-carboxylate reductase n=1 Tax=Aspergillus steynii IBT 23096 TaxID=1392250 RepID=A0A2I2FWI1_9EURO|nr:pyrroline-5-carboxylate reductase [Aspergillus steynii IBT 23096]PLB44967.1 pyrroline-5-carboxylate reductase [Aspergillus steynii IBT 23096]